MLFLLFSYLTTNLVFEVELAPFCEIENLGCFLSAEDYKRGVCLDDLNVGHDWNALFNTLNIHPCQFYLNVIVVNFRDNIDCDEDS